MNKSIVKKTRPNPPVGGSCVLNKSVVLSTNIIDISAIDQAQLKVDKLLASLLKVQKLLQQIII